MKTPLVLAICPLADCVPETIMHRFTQLYREEQRVLCASFRERCCQLVDAAAGNLPAVYLRVEPYLRYGAAAKGLKQWITVV